jgi:hypothetical protein
MTANDLRIGDRIQDTRILAIVRTEPKWVELKSDDGELSVSLSTDRATRLLQDGSWKLIPAAPDILAQLREALGWQEGSMEEILAVLRACKGFYDLTEIKTDKEYARREHAVMVNLNHAVHKIK